MGLVRSAQSPLKRATVAIVGTMIAATLAVGALAVGHSAGDDLAARKLSRALAKGVVVSATLTGGGKPLR